MAVSFVEVASGTAATATSTITASLSNTPTSGDVLVLIYVTTRAIGRDVSSISGAGGSWSSSYTTNPRVKVWVNTTANASGTITVTQTATGTGGIEVYLIRGLTSSTVSGSTVSNNTASAFASSSLSAGNNQAVMIGGYVGSTGAPTWPSSSTPGSGWTTRNELIVAQTIHARRIPTDDPATSHTLSVTPAAGGSNEVAAVMIGTFASASTTAVVAATLPSLSSAVAATSTVTAASAAALPSLSASVAGLTTIPAASAATLPSLSASVAATSTATAAVAATLPSLSTEVLAVADDTTFADVSATLPSLSSTATATATESVAVAATLPSLSAAIDAVSSVPSGDYIGATLPSLSSSVVVVSDSEDVTTVFDFVDLEDLLFVDLAADDDLDIAVPILSEKHPSPVLTAEQPTHQAWVDYTPTTDVVGFPHIFVDDVDITYFRGNPTLVNNWTKEAPWGDKTAMWEMPQLDPWDVPGSGDLSFIRKGARVVIGIVDDITGEFTRKWSGSYHARRKGFDSAEDYVFEAHGTMWAAMGQAIEPVPYQPPVDIGVLIPRLLNKLIGRPFNPIPETLTGILTRYRGARDEKVWQSVQNILSREGWTDDGRQWTLVQVAEDEFRLALKKPMDELDGTVAWGNPGADFDITIDEDSRVDAVFCRWVKPGGGESANVKYPGLELLNGLPYPNSDAGNFINAGEDNDDTDSGTGVTDWQTKVKGLGYTSLAVTGVMSPAWVDVVRDVQHALDLTVDGSIGPQTWTASFTSVDESIDLTPRRLPMAFKSEAWPTIDGANGQILGDNPAFDGLPPNYVYLDMGTNITRAEVAKAARTYLAVHGEAVVTGTARFRGCLDDLARTDLDVGSNFEVRGWDGSDVPVQVGRLSVDLDSSEGAYVVSTDVDEQARDALTIDQILQRNRDALPDPARRPGNPNRTSRSVRDEGFSWDADSPCGKLTRTAVNGDTGLWSRKVIPFAEVGQLAGIRLHSTVPFAMMVMASLRFTENMARNLVGDPFASTDPYRPVWTDLEAYGILGAWGCQSDACGYSPGQEADGYGFTGDFIEGTTLEYVTETQPYVAVLLFARGDSGFVWGDDEDEGFLPAVQT